MPPRWSDLLALALVGTARSGGQADALLDSAAAYALRKRAGVPLLAGVAPPVPAPVDDALPAGAAAVRAEALLATDSATRGALPVRDAVSRLELLAEWLAAAVAAHRRLPAELVPALLDAGRQHRELRPFIPLVAGPVAGWLAGQRADWAYASSTPAAESTVDDNEQWELGSLGHRVAHLSRLRRRDPVRGRELLETAWDAQPAEERAALLATLGTALSTSDEPLLERALGDRRRQVRDVASDLLSRLPDSGYGRRMADRAVACVELRGTRRIGINPPAACDGAMRRDGIAPRPPGGVGERAWWLEEILARTPMPVWPEPTVLLARQVSEGWFATVLRGLARAAATQRDGAWAAALVDPLTAEVGAQDHPADRLLIEALHAVLPPDDLAARATAALRRGLAGAAAPGLEQILALCPRPWPPAVAEAVLAALAEQLGQRGAGWRVTGICELAALRLPAEVAPRALALLEQVRAVRARDAGLVAVERLSATLLFRHDMIKELG